MATLSTILPEQSPLTWFDAPNNVTATTSPSSFTAANAVAESILGVCLPEEDNLWGLSPLSPVLPTWNEREQMLDTPRTGIDLKKSRAPNIQPASSLSEVKGLDANTSPRRQCQRVESRADQYEHPPGSKRNNSGGLFSAYQKRRKGSQTSTRSDESHEEKVKRDKYLERNRIAATKCRQKKKEQTKILEARFEEQSYKKDKLVNELGRLRTEALYLKDEVLKHAECGDRSIKLHVAQMASKVSHSYCGPGLADSLDNTASYDGRDGLTAQTICPFGFDSQKRLI